MDGLGMGGQWGAISQLIVSQINPDAFPITMFVFNRKMAFCASGIPLTQFGFVSGWCCLSVQVPKNRLPSTAIRLPSKQTRLLQ
jgi:hypothetical protein